MFDGELDGRDPLVRKHYRQRKEMVAKLEIAEVKLAGYTDPWLPAFYSQFDDVMPGRAAYFDNRVDGIPGYRRWSIPVTEVVRVVGGFDQISLGSLEIVETPNNDGTSEITVAIR